MMRCPNAYKYLFYIFSHLADALIQSNLQEQLWLNALFKGTLTDSLQSAQGFEPFDYSPNALNH